MRRRRFIGFSAAGMAGLAGCPAQPPDREGGPQHDSSEPTEETPTENSTPTDSSAEEEEARLLVDDIEIDPGRVEQARQVEITVTVSNEGNAAGSESLSLLVDDAELTTVDVSLDPGETAEVTHAYRPGVVGEREVKLGERTATFEVSQYPAEFVTQDGPKFLVDGERYFFHGTSNDLLYRSPDWYLNEVLAEAQNIGLSAIRMVTIGVGPDAPDCDFNRCQQDRYSFMPEPGEFDDATFRQMDRVIYKAKQYGIRLVLPFVDNYAPSGMAQFVEWSDDASRHDDFYTDPECRRMYKEFVEGFLTRTNSYTGVEYRDDPTILMWELANEPMAHGITEDGDGGDPAPEKLQSWIEEMSAFVKGIDSNHLLGTGGQGFYPDKLYHQDKGEDFIANNRVEHIDCCSVHMYPKHWYEGEEDRVQNASEKGRESIRVHTEDAHEVVEKPVYFGEFRPHTDIDRFSADAEQKDGERATILNNWYDAMDATNVDGAIHWTFFDPYDNEENVVLTDRDEPLSEQYNGYHVVYPWDEATVSTMRSYSETVREKSST
ncbi:cellulase family glycosylhydrolase [Halorubrum sp. AS12]|uniref:cellulase family glycosylhydrolase n=1 Tax=Halorubrum sp. AS12 TaxID=3409687 RepID=UPI003DA7765C